MKIKLRPTIFVEAKFEVRHIFKSMPKFRTRPNVRGKVRPGPILRTGQVCHVRYGKITGSLHLSYTTT